MSKPISIPNTTPITFHDSAYKSRTLFLSDSNTALNIIAAKIEVSDPAAIAYLDQHPDFNCLEEGRV